ncbi:hypothetical protein ACHAXR_009830 [Thalassiosira sp. AJA248-18]
MISSSQCLSVPTITSPPFANLSPIAFGTLNPAYDDTPNGIANLLDSLPRGTLIDTAEKYGPNKNGDAEAALGRALQICGRTFRYDDDNDGSGDSITPDLLLCSKFAPKPWRLSAESVVEACKASIERLGVDSLYLYQLHYSDAISQPFKIIGYVDNKDELYWEGMAQCYHEGLVKHIGVCNYGPENVRAAYEFFSNKNVPLVSNQINFNLMRYRSSMATKEVCDELGIQVFGYHPLGSGVLTGVYDKDWFSKVPPGLNKVKSKSTRVRWYQKNCAPIIDAVQRIAEKRGKSAAQVAINWNLVKGIIPLCGARNEEQVLDALGGATGPEGSWRLTESEVDELDEASNASAEYARGFELI